MKALALFTALLIAATVIPARDIPEDKGFIPVDMPSVNLPKVDLPKVNLPKGENI